MLARVKPLAKQYCHVPFISDWEQDNLRSRALQIAMFIAIFTVVGYTVLAPVFRTSPSQKSLTVAKVTPFTLPDSSVFFGDSFIRPPAVRVVNNNNDGLIDKVVYFSIATDRALSTPRTKTSRATILTANTWPALQQQVVFQPLISPTINVTVVTDVDGFARMDSFSLLGGAAGTYEITASCEGFSYTFPLSTTFQSNVASLVPMVAAPASFVTTVGSPLSVQPSVQVLDSNKAPLAGRYVSVISLNQVDFFSQQNYKLAFFANGVAGPSDANGMVYFSGLTLTAANTDSINAGFVCEGVQALWTDPQTTAPANPILISPAAVIVSVLTWPSVSVMETAPFDVQPVVRVTALDGTPLAGKTVFAMTVTEAGLYSVLFHTVADQGPRKWLANMTATTDASGTAQFNMLAYIGSGLVDGPFQIVFIVDGVASNPSPEITVSTAVTQVVIQGVPTGATIDISKAAFDYSLSAGGLVLDVGLNGLVSPSPSILVTDVRLNPLRNKIVTPFLVTGRGALTWVDPLIRGGIFAVTDDFGFAEFSARVYHGLQYAGPEVGNVQILFQCDGVNSSVVDVFIKRTTTGFPIDGCGYLTWDVPFPLLASTNRTLDVTPVLTAYTMTGDVMDPGPYAALINIVTSTDINLLQINPTPSSTINASGQASFEDLYFTGYRLSYYVLGTLEEIAYFPAVDESSLVASCMVVDTRKLLADSQIFYAQWITVPPTSATGGTPFSSQPVLRVFDANYRPLSDAVLRVYIQSGGPVFSETNFPPPYKIFTATGGQYVLSTVGQFSQSGYYGLESNVSSDANGYVSFTDLAFARGFIGVFTLVFTVDGILASGPLPIITVIDAVVGIEIVTQPAAAATVNVPLSVQPVVRVVDADGNGVAGYEVGAISLHNDGSGLRDYGSIEAVSGAYVTLGAIHSPCSSISNASGYANFSDVRFTTLPATNYPPLIRFSVCQLWAYLYVDSQAVVVFNPVVTVNVVTPPSPIITANATPRQVLQVLAATASSPAVQVLVVLTVIDHPPIGLPSYQKVDSNSDGTTITGSVCTTDANGMATFNSFSIRNGVPGVYEFSVSAAGITAPDTVRVTIVNVADAISIIGQPVRGTVGQFLSGVGSVLVLAAGYPLVGKEVTCVLVSQPGNGELDASTTVATTDDAGVANFALKLRAGSTGLYTFRFYADAVFTPPTDSIFVTNQISAVTVTSMSKDATVGIALSSPPVIQVEGSYTGVKTVIVSVGDSDSGVILSSSTGQMALTDASGSASFTNFVITSASTANYSFIFTVDGIQSEPYVVLVTNTQQANFDKFSSWQTQMWVMLLSGTPVFLGNVGRNHWVLLLPALGIGIYYQVVLATIFTDYSAERVVFNRIPTVQHGFITAIVMANLLLVLLAVVLILLFMAIRRNARAVDDDRITTAKILVAKLLPVGVANFRRTELLHDVRNKEMDEYLKLEQEKDDAKRGVEKLKSNVSTFFKELVASPVNKHAPYETWQDFRFPMRLVAAVVLSLILMFYELLGAVLLIEYANYYLTEIRNNWVKYNLTVNTRLQQINDVLNTVNAVSTSISSNNATKAATQLAQASGVDVPQIPTQLTLPDRPFQLLFFAQDIGNVTNDYLGQFQSAIFAAAVAAAVLAYLYMAMLLFLTVRLYRRRIFRMRQGIYFFKEKQPDILNATTYIGMQVTHCAVAYAAIWALLTLIFVCVGFAGIRQLLFNKISLAILLSSAVVVVVVRTIAKKIAVCILVRKNRVQHRRWFSVYDLVFIFMGLASGLVIALVRFVVLVLTTVLFYARLDMPLSGALESKDPGFAAYTGLIFLDHSVNNPVLLLACHFLSKPYLLQSNKDFELGTQMAAGVRRRTIRNRFWLYITLTTNPQLRRLRGFELARERAAMALERAPTVPASEEMFAL